MPNWDSCQTLLSFIQNGVYFMTLETESCQASNKSVLILILDCFHEHILEVYTDFYSSSVFIALFGLKCHLWQRCYKTITRNLTLMSRGMFLKRYHIWDSGASFQKIPREILEHPPLTGKPTEVLHWLQWELPSQMQQYLLQMGVGLKK